MPVTKKWKMKTLIWLIALVMLPSVMAITEIQYSLDNSSFTNATYTDQNNATMEILGDGITTCTTYYFRLRHVYTTGVSNWTYTNAETTCSWSDEKVEIAAIIGILGIIALFTYLYTTLDDDHFLLKYFFLFASVSLMLLIPNVLLESTKLPETAKTFYISVVWAIRFFWVYVGVYFFYKVITKFMDMVAGE